MVHQAIHYPTPTYFCNLILPTRQSSLIFKWAFLHLDAFTSAGPFTSPIKVSVSFCVSVSLICLMNCFYQKTHFKCLLLCEAFQFISKISYTILYLASIFSLKFYFNFFICVIIISGFYVCFSSKVRNFLCSLSATTVPKTISYTYWRALTMCLSRAQQA